MPRYGPGNLPIGTVADFDFWISLCQISNVKNRNFLTNF